MRRERVEGVNECKSFFPISNVGVGFLFGANNTFSSARVVVSSGFKKDDARTHGGDFNQRILWNREAHRLTHVRAAICSLFLPKTAKKCNSDVHVRLCLSRIDNLSVLSSSFYPTHIISMHGARRRPSLFSRSYTVFLPPCLVILSFPLSVLCLAAGSSRLCHKATIILVDH